MALPTQAEQLTLEYTVATAPYVNVTGNSTILADGIHFVISGSPYYATGPAGAPPVTYNAFQFFMLF